MLYFFPAEEKPLPLVLNIYQLFWKDKHLLLTHLWRHRWCQKGDSDLRVWPWNQFWWRQQLKFQACLTSWLHGMQTSHSYGSVNIVLVSMDKIERRKSSCSFTLKAWPRLGGISVLVVMVASVRSATVCITPAAFNGNLLPK